MKCKILILFVLLLLTASCATPLRDWLKIGKKEDKTEQKIDANQEKTIDKVKGTAWATDYALSKDTNRNIFSETAKDINTRTISAVGTPDLKDVKTWQSIVDGLVSTNEQLKVAAQKALDGKDREIIGLQSELDKLQGKLTEIQKEKDELGLANSQLADKWAKLVRIFKFVFYGIIIAVILAVLSQILSVVVPPPYNTIFSIVALVLGGIGKMIFKLAPNSKKFAGVVSETVHNQSEKTLKTLVDAIQDIRNRPIKPEDIAPRSQEIKIKDLIDNTLLAATDRDAREKIVEIKKEIGFI